MTPVKSFSEKTLTSKDFSPNMLVLIFPECFISIFRGIALELFHVY